MYWLTLSAAGRPRIITAIFLQWETDSSDRLQWMHMSLGAPAECSLNYSHALTQRSRSDNYAHEYEEVICLEVIKKKNVFQQEEMKVILARTHQFCLQEQRLTQIVPLKI